MATYVVSYDLHRPGQNYAGLHDAIKSLGTWWHHLESTWHVVTDKSAKQVRDTLAPELDANDKILVVRSGGEGAWKGINDNGSAWLKNNL
jgi:hypothetical protein